MANHSKYHRIWARAGNDPHSLVAHASEFLSWLKTQNYSLSTYQNRRHYLGFFLHWCEEQNISGVDEVTKPVIERYQSYLCRHYSERLDGPLSVNSRRAYLIVIQIFFRWLVKKHDLLYNPANDIVLPKPSKHLPRNVLSREEAEAIINLPDLDHPFGLRARAMLEVLYSTGIRADELRLLKVSDFDFSRETLLVREGKNKKDRVVPIGERAIKWVKKYLIEVRSYQLCGKDDGAVFLTQYGQPFASANSLIAIVHDYVKAAGHKGACHNFRHAMATLMLENGAGMRYIQEMLGHAAIKSTEVYTRVAIGKVKQIHALTHPAELWWEEPQGETDEHQR